jgi:hypothetical protein
MDGAREIADRLDPEILSSIPYCPYIYSGLVEAAIPIWSMTKADLE